MNSTAILVSTALVTLLACSGSTTPLDTGSDDGGASPDGGATTDGGGDSSSGVSNQQAANDAATAFCNLAASCAPAYITLGYGATAECIQRLSASLVSGIGASGSTETTAEIEACAAVIPSTSCADFLGRNLPAVCTPPAGTLAGGAACAADSQCMGGRCHLPANAVCGTCGESAATGAACVEDDDCVNGDKCGTAGTCVAYGGMGASCSATAPCNPVYGCVGGTCGAPGGANADCVTSDACDQLHGIFCSNTKCTSVTFAPASAACGLVSGALTLCAGPGADCQGVMAPNYEGTCLAPAADGASCDATNGPMCEAPAVCAGGICKVSDPTMCH